jgi:two-component system response regulator HydG
MSMSERLKQPVMAIIEDDEDTSELIQAFFRNKSFKTVPFADAASFLKAMKNQGLAPDVILTDLMLPEMDGIQLVKRLRTLECEAPVILLTATNSSETAIQAIEAGAYDFVVKPLNFPQLQVSVERALHFGGIREENKSLKEAISVKSSHEGGIIGKSAGLKQAVDLARRVSDSIANVLITGETGTGKEVIAKAIHQLGSRAALPFIAINCSAIPENLLESELFGHAKGSFTGAMDKKIGLFEEAGEGTLFLDEIGDLSLQLQAKLLRVLQERKIRRIGENQFRPVSARIVTATHKDLVGMVKAKTFREDLYFRLRVIPINLPPLRQRQEDILPLAEFFLKKFAALNMRNVKGFAKDAVEKMLKSPWHGNVRELENSIERAVVLSSGDTLTAADFASFDEEWPLDTRVSSSTDAAPSYSPEPVSYAAPATLSSSELFTVDVASALPTLEELSNLYIEFAVNRNNGAKDKTATELGIDRKTLYRRLSSRAGAQTAAPMSM